MLRASKEVTMPIGSELSAAQGALVSRSFPCLDYSPPRCREVMCLKTEDGPSSGWGGGSYDPRDLEISGLRTSEFRAGDGGPGRLAGGAHGAIIFVPRAALDRLPPSAATTTTSRSWWAYADESDGFTWFNTPLCSSRPQAVRAAWVSLRIGRRHGVRATGRGRASSSTLQSHPASITMT